MPFWNQERSRKYTVLPGARSHHYQLTNPLTDPPRFPGQEHVAGNSKIPSIIYYDKSGKLMAAGAEAESNSILAQAEDENWIKAELYAPPPLSYIQSNSYPPPPPASNSVCVPAQCN